MVFVICAFRTATSAQVLCPSFRSTIDPDRYLRLHYGSAAPCSNKGQLRGLAGDGYAD